MPELSPTEELLGWKLCLRMQRPSKLRPRRRFVSNMHRKCVCVATGAHKLGELDPCLWSSNKRYGMVPKPENLTSVLGSSLKMWLWINWTSHKEVNYLQFFFCSRSLRDPWIFAYNKIATMLTGDVVVPAADLSSVWAQILLHLQGVTRTHWCHPPRFKTQHQNHPPSKTNNCNWSDN